MLAFYNKACKKARSTFHNFYFPFQPPENSAKSTGVFQDEELLFSQKLQKDNDPEVDLFAGTKKGVSPNHCGNF